MNSMERIYCLCLFLCSFPFSTYLNPDTFLRPTLITSTSLKLSHDLSRWQFSKYTVQALNDSHHFLCILVIYVQVSLWDTNPTTTREDHSVQEFCFFVPDAYIIICILWGLNFCLLYIPHMYFLKAFSNSLWNEYGEEVVVGVK